MHPQFTVDARPLIRRTIPIKFDAIAIRIVQVNRFADAVVRRAVDLDAVIEQSLERRGEFGAGWVKNRKMIQASATGRRLQRPFAGPGIQRDVVMVTARGKKNGALTITLRHFETDRLAIT